MNVPADLRYAKTHEWIRVEGDTVTVGITDHAQTELTDIVYAEPPKVGTEVQAGATAAVVESVKAASDVYAPVAGEVIAVNEALRDAPEQINGDAFSAWMWKMKPAGDTASLMNAEAYAQNIAAQK
jgi:glycine cleavage system H protein